jgi:glycosyltransferase involved in cell wall biosynthesis
MIDEFATNRARARSTGEVPIELWFVNHYAQTPEEAGGTRHYELARQLAARGFVPTVIASSVRHPEGLRRFPLRPWVRHGATEVGHWIWLAGPEYRGNGARRMAGMMVFAALVAGLRLPRGRWAPDIVVGSTVHPFAALAAWFLAWRHRARFIFEIRDLWPLTLIEYGALREGGVLTQLLYGIEGFLCRRADLVVTLLPKVSDYLSERHGVPQSKVLYCPNFYAGAVPAPKSSAAELAQGEQKAAASFTFIYMGSFGHGNGVETIVDAFVLAHARVPSLRLRLVGHGPGLEGLRSRAAATGLAADAVLFEPPVPKRDVITVLRSADAAVINVPDKRLYRFGISMNKLFDYMASGIPTLIASNAANNPVAECEGGLCVPSGDVEALADAMARLSGMPHAELVAMAARSQMHVAQQYSANVVGLRLASALHGLLGGKKDRMESSCVDEAQADGPGAGV